MTETSVVRCLNCGTTLEREFCPDCGQSASTKRLVSREVFSDIAKKISNFDSKAAATVIGLTRNPGQLCRDYVEGKRIGVVAPLRYCLVVLATILLWYAFIGYDLAASSPDLGFETTEKTRALQRVVATYVAKHLNLVVIAALPIFAAIVRGLFRRSGMNYAEVLAFVLYVIAHIMLLSLVLSVFRAAAPTLVLGLRILFQVAFFSWAAAVFFRVSAFVALVKTVVATMFYFVVVSILVFIMALPQVVSTIKSFETAPEAHSTVGAPNGAQ